MRQRILGTRVRSLSTIVGDIEQGMRIEAFCGTRFDEMHQWIRSRHRSSVHLDVVARVEKRVW